MQNRPQTAKAGRRPASELGLVTDYADWGVPQANANAISVTGVPLLTGAQPVFSSIGTINAGAAYNSPNAQVVQPGYELSLEIWESGAGAASPVVVEVIWADGPLGATVSQQNYYIWPGTPSPGNQIFGKGPTRSTYMTVNILNPSAAMQYSYDLQVYERSHLYTRDDFRSVQCFGSASGNSFASQDPLTGLLGTALVSIGAGGVQTYELPLYSGLAYLYFDTTSAAADLQATLTSSAGSDGLGIGARLQHYQSNAIGQFFSQIALPTFQCRLLLTNQNAAAKTAFFSLYTIEQSQ